MKWHFSFVLTVILLTSGCTAQKTATVTHTLKGNNSSMAASTAPTELPTPSKLPDSCFATLSELTDQFAEDFVKQCRKDQKIFLDSASIREANTNDGNFSKSGGVV